MKLKYSSRFLCLIVILCAAVTRAEDKPIVLFNGKDTTGWKQCGPGSFEVKDGTLETHDGMGMLWHEKEFGDFILTLEFKVAQKSNNSGVFVHFPDPGDDPFVAVKMGHEIQICDTQEGNQTGAIYDAKNSTELASKPVGEWNAYEIKVVGPQYTIKLNDKLVNEYKSDRGLRGHIGLQNHDPSSHVSFRNIKVVELPAGGANAAPAKTEPAKPQAAEAPKPATQAAAPAPKPIETKDLQPGLTGEYFKDLHDLDALKTAKTPFLLRTDKNIRFKSAEGQFHDTKLALRFSARWSGILRIDKPGTYTFTLSSDDGSRLFIGDQKIVECPTGEPMSEKSGPAELAKGDYPIRVEFKQDGGTAGCILSWQPPGGEKKGIPDSLLFHEKSAEQIGWDKPAFDKFVWDKKGWKREAGSRVENMDYGPFLSATIEASKDNNALKGIAIKLGKDEEAAVCFDTELLRFAAGWTGGFLNLKGVAYNGDHGPTPSPDGDIVFFTQQEPGCKEGELSGESLADPRPTPFGPLPQEWARYKGLYLNGDKVIVSYRVGKTDVLEMPAIAKVGKLPVFLRTIQLAASDQPLTMLVSDSGNKASTQPDELKLDTGVALSEGISDKTSGRRRYIVFAPRKQPKTYKVALFQHDSKVDVPAIEKLLDTKEDLAAMCKGGPAHWTQPITTAGTLGTGDGPYVVDTLTAPEENPYKSWLRFGGLDFFSDGRAALCTWNGDVWIVSGIDDSLKKLTWKRYATGLFQTLGLKIVNDQVYTLGRDQITRFTDINNDGEADFYECFNNDCMVSTSFHEFSFDLQTDSAGNFYYAKAGPVRPGGRGWQVLTDHNGTMLKVSKDGKKLEVFATGLRAPNGMGVGPHDEITVGDNEGTWTPACRLSLVTKGAFLGVVDTSKKTPLPTDYDRPICWLPHGDVDNSSGGQVWVTSDKWGPFKNELLHTSYGQCSLFKVMMENVDGQVQGGVVKFPKLKFETGICRPRFNATDGQLYITGLRGWQTTGILDGALYRVRYTGKPVNMPTALHVTDKGVAVTFTGELDSASATNGQNFSVEQWNYLWSKEYGSPEFSVEDPKEKGHDPVEITSVSLSPDHKTVMIGLADVKVVMQMKIQMKLKAADGSPLDFSIYNTINRPAKTATAGAGAVQAP